MISVGLGLEGERIGVVEPELGVGRGLDVRKRPGREVNVIPVRELKTAFRATHHNLCYLRLAPAQGSDPKKKVRPRLLRCGVLGMQGIACFLMAARVVSSIVFKNPGQ